MTETPAQTPVAVAPVVAVVGRPNVGKSTLVNRILGRRVAVVEDVPGVTRDRVAYDADWNGRRFVLVDTGGWQPDSRGMEAAITEQAKLAAETADAVLFVVDTTVGATDEDESVGRILRRAGKPILLAANKVDDQRLEADATALWNLGVGEPVPVSALHGRGSGDLLDQLLAALPEPPPLDDEPAVGPRRVALVGKPNAGKSSLLNKLAGSARALVDESAGTTRDPVDELVELDGRTWEFVDTAGIRRRVKEASGSEYYSFLRTRRAIEAAEVVAVLLDASAPLSEQDLRIISMASEAGRALVLLYNKWDLVDEDRRERLEKEIDRQLVRVRWAPRVNVSALTGWHVNRLTGALDTALDGWQTRVGTGQLNGWLNDVVAATPPPIRGGRQTKVLFATQAATAPPQFVLFTTGQLEAGYLRFLERRLREEFGFVGSPVQLNVRIRQRRDRH